MLGNNFKKCLQKMGFEIYESRGLVEVNISEKIKTEREVENQHLTVNELLKKTQNIYQKTEKEGDVV